MSQLFPIIDDEKTLENITLKFELVKKQLHTSKWFSIDLDGYDYALLDPKEDDALELNKIYKQEIAELNFIDIIKPTALCPPIINLNVMGTINVLNKLDEQSKIVTYFYIIKGFSINSIKEGTNDDFTKISNIYSMYQHLKKNVIYVFDELIVYKKEL